MRTTVLTKLEDLEAVRQQWSELALCDPRDGFFRTPAWCLPWLAHIQPDAKPFVILVQDDDDQIVGLAPLCRVNYRDHGFRLNVLSSMGREVVSGDFLDYIAAPHTRARVLDAILNCLIEMRSEWEMLVVGEALDGGDLHCAMEAFAAAQGLPLRRQEERICPYIELPPAFETYLRGVSQKMRYEIRRDSRDLLERAGSRIELFTDPQDVCRNIDTMIQLHTAHWVRVSEPGTLGRPGFDRFLKTVCMTPPAGGSSRLYLLTHEDKPVAALMAFCFGENMMFYQTGWDPDSPLAKLSPGMVLVARAIRDAIENGFRYFDFLRGDETYKTRLTKSSRRTITLLLARSFFAKEYLRVARLKDVVKRALANDGSPEQALQTSPGGRK